MGNRQTIKINKTEIVQSLFQSYKGSSSVISIEMHQDLLKLKIYQDYQQLLELEDKEPKQTSPRP